jgi:hypothetical protein
VSDQQLQEVIVPTVWEGLNLVPSSPNVAALDAGHAASFKRQGPPVAAVFGGFGLLLLRLSFLGGQQIPTGDSGGGPGRPCCGRHRRPDRPWLDVEAPAIDALELRVPIDEVLNPSELGGEQPPTLSASGIPRRPI